MASQLSRYCDLIRNRLWRHQQNENWASETQGWRVKIVVFINIYGFVMLCKKWNKIMYVLSWQTVSALTQVLFWCLFPLLLCNLGNNHQNNPLVSAETVRHWSTHSILWCFSVCFIWNGCSKILNGISNVDFLWTWKLLYLSLKDIDDIYQYQT